MIGYQRIPRVLAIGWCLGVPLRLRLGSRLSQMMTDDMGGAFGTTQVICYHPLINIFITFYPIFIFNKLPKFF